MFNGLIEDIRSQSAKWSDFLDHPTAELGVPEPWMSADDISVTNQNARSLKQMLLMKVMRPDRLLASAELFVKKVLTEDSMSKE